MKKILIAFLTAVLFGGAMFAQTVKVTGTEKITSTENGEFYFPKFSPDGTEVFFTGPEFKGIYAEDLNSKKIKTITDDENAGYNFKFAENGSKLIYRTSRFINYKKYYSLKSIDLKNGSVNTFETDQRNLSVPEVMNDGNLVYLLNNKVKTVASLKKTPKMSMSQLPVATIENSSISVIYPNGKKKCLQPLGKGNYIWPEVSPDGSKLLFTLAGKGTFVSDMNGNVLVDLGYANSPNWSPDGKWIVYMVDRDNGIRVTESELYVTDAAGNKTFKLTDTKNVHEMYPEWSPNGKKIVCATDDGAIYLLTLTID